MSESSQEVVGSVAGAAAAPDAPPRARRVNGAIGAVVALLVAGALAFLLLGQQQAGGELRAVVHDGDGATHELPLAHDAQLVVATSLGENLVVVQDGSVYVREADCDNQDCVRQGRINAPGQQIICLPHKLWIEVVAAGEAGGEMDEQAVPGGSGGVDVTSR